MELPIKKRKAKSINPNFLIIFGKEKAGKTTVLSMLENNLIVDINHGAGFLDALAVDINNVDELLDLYVSIKKAGNPYKYITIDTATDLEEIVLPLALNMYRKTPMGKKFGRDPDTGEYHYMDVRMLPEGAGYLYIREAYKKIIKNFKSITEHLILIAHTKDRTINRSGKELSENMMDLSGKLGRIIAADADAIGYMYRDKNKNILNFNGGGDFLVEARAKHLRGKEIVLAESDDNNVITSHWDRIFI